MAFNFEKYGSEGRQFMNELSRELSCEQEPDRAARILKSVLHTLRDHLSVEESLQLLAQLPMFLKAVYVDGWTGKQKKRAKHLNDFLREIHEHDGFPAAGDFGEGTETYALTVMVFLMLRKYVSEGEMKDIAALLPKEIKPLIDQSVY